MGESTPAPAPNDTQVASPLPAPTDPPHQPPAELVPPPSRRACLAWYAGAAVFTAVALAAGLRLDKVSLREPLAYDQDVLLIMPMVKATLERGSHWRNERMGYPGVYELYDFPVVDHAHFALIWLVGRVVSDWVVVYNLYHLLTWPLTTLTAMWAFRRLGLTLPFAAAGAVLYAFQPYHYLRGEAHYFLAAYWVVPLSWLPALALCKGEFPFVRRDPSGAAAWAFRTRAAAWQVLLAALTASAGAYYAFFACALYAVAGAYGWVVHRTWRAAGSAGVLAALVMAFGVINHLPSVPFALKYGRAAVTERYAEDSERYGMKLAQLLLPIDAHNVTVLARMKAAYTANYPLMNENNFSPLGLVAGAGLVGLFGVLVIPNRLGWPYRPAAALALFIVLFSTVGGFGAVFNLVVLDQIRCLNRFSIYLAFLCLLAVVWAADRATLTGPPRVRRSRHAIAAGLVLLGIADQTPTAWFSERVVKAIEADAERFRADRRFFARVEELAPGARVFCLPYIPFPEEPYLHDMGTYEHARGYLHTASLVLGYAPIKFREADAWLRSVAFDAPANRVRRMVARGFDGVFVDGRGFVTQADGNNLVRELRASAPVPLPEVIHEDGRQVFLDLRPYRDWLRGQDSLFLEREEARERDWVALCWLRGFTSPEPYGSENHFRWVYRTAAFQIVNPSDRVRTFKLEATFSTDHEGEFGVAVDGGAVTWADKPGGAGPWADAFTVGADPDAPPQVVKPRAYRLEIPPGRHTVRLTCTPPSMFISGDTRPICYYLQDVTFTEVTAGR